MRGLFKFWGLVLSIVLSMAVVSCSSDDLTTPDDPAETLASASVGAEGGVVSTPDGDVTLNIPAGALANEVEITVSTPEPTLLPVLENTHFEYGPDGTQFAVPISLTLSSDAEIPQGEMIGAGWLDRDAERIMILPSEHDSENNTVTAQVSHFSEVSLWVGPASYIEIPLDLRTGWESDYGCVKVSWTRVHGFPIIVRRASNNATIPPAMPAAIYRTIYNSETEITYDCAIGPEAKMYWYWLQYDYGSHLSEPTQAIRFAHFGTGEAPPPIENLNVVPLSTDGMRISWNPTSAAATYDLDHYITGVGNWENVAHGIPFTTYFHEETGLPEDTDVIYRVRGVNEHGTGPWVQASGHTGASCEVEIVYYDGTPVVDPVLPGTYVILRANNCGNEPDRIFEWYYVADHGGGSQEYMLGQGLEYAMYASAELEMRLKVINADTGVVIETLNVIVPVIPVQAYSEIHMTDYKPHYTQSFTSTLRTIQNANYVDVMIAYPEVTSIDWTIYTQVDESVVLTYTGTQNSSWVVAGNTLDPGWYRIRGVGRTSAGEVYCSPGLTSFEIEE
ncbi:MAG: hypothetical protein GY780_01465 [bacterium]|nr:hypothetical protein [bacterium]